MGKAAQNLVPIGLAECQGRGLGDLELDSTVSADDASAQLNFAPQADPPPTARTRCKGFGFIFGTHRAALLVRPAPRDNLAPGRSSTGQIKDHCDQMVHTPLAATKSEAIRVILNPNKGWTPKSCYQVAHQ